MEKREIILGCSPGHDDVIVIIMATRHPAVDLLGTTTVAGNRTLDKTSINGLNACQKLETNVPVYAGMPQLIMRQQIVVDNIHGEIGLDGPVFKPLTRQTGNTHAVKCTIDTLMASNDDITLVPVGPLSNTAVAMRTQLAILPKIREIVLIGGAYGIGDSIPSAESDIFADPEAVCMVLTSGVPLAMMGFDFTNQAVCAPNVIVRVEGVDSPAGELFGGIVNFIPKTQPENYGLAGGPIHDATCIGYLINPDGIKTQEMYVGVDVNSGPCCRRTVCDEPSVLGRPANTGVDVIIDTDWFWGLVEECVRGYTKTH